MSADSDVKTAKDKTPRPKRHGRGFAQTGGLLSDSVRKVTEKRGFAQTKLLTQWDAIAGEAIAKIARPVKVSFAREGFGATLTILTDGAHAPEVQMMLPQLQAKVNACYGYNAISRIRITQTAETGFAEDRAAFSPKPTSRTLAPKQAETLSGELSAIKDPSLRDALEQLGKNVLTR